MSAYVGAGLVLVSLGLYAAITRRNLLQLIIGLELMARGVTLVIILAGMAQQSLAVAQAMVITAILIETVTVAIALSLVVAAYKHNNSLSTESLRRLRG